MIGHGSFSRKNIANADLVYPALAIVVLCAQQSAEDNALEIALLWEFWCLSERMVCHPPNASLPISGLVFERP